MDSKKILSERVEVSYKDDILIKIMFHVEQFEAIFKGRYMEALPSLIKYKDFKEIVNGIDFLKLEYGLRNGFNMVIGETKNGNIRLIGYTNENLTSENPINFLKSGVLDEKDIHFIIPHEEQLPTYTEISSVDDYQSGNFVVIRNKLVNYVTDIEIINYYIEELAETVKSRFSITMQAKLVNFFISESGDESMNQVIAQIYNGSPIIEASTLFDPTDQIVKLDNAYISNNLVELKRVYQNVLSEMNNMLGVQSSGVDKESGVSEVETLGNDGYITSNANIYLSSRQNGLDKLNKRYGCEIKAYYNDNVASELMKLNMLKNEVGESQ